MDLIKSLCLSVAELRRPHGNKTKTINKSIKNTNKEQWVGGENRINDVFLVRWTHAGAGKSRPVVTGYEPRRYDARREFSRARADGPAAEASVDKARAAGASATVWRFYRNIIKIAWGIGFLCRDDLIETAPAGYNNRFFIIIFLRFILFFFFVTLLACIHFFWPNRWGKKKKIKNQNKTEK